MSKLLGPQKFVGFKMDADIVAALEKQAVADRRTLASLLRKIVAEYAASTAPAKKANGLHKEHASAP